MEGKTPEEMAKEGIARSLKRYKEKKFGLQALINRETGERPNRYFYLPLKRTLIRAKRAVTIPGYVQHHSKRLLTKMRRTN